MRHLTRHQVSYEAISLSYVLPFVYDPETSDAVYLQRAVKLFEEVQSFARIQPHAPATTDEKWRSIHLKYLYEGYDEYYPLEIILEVVHVTDDKNQTSYLGLIGHYEHTHGGLFDELIDEKVLPDWAKRLGLKDMPL